MRRATRHEDRWRQWASPEWALFNTLFGGVFIILLGGLLYLAATNDAPNVVTWSNFWAYLLLGLGIMLIVRGFFGLIIQRYHGFGSIIGGLALVIIGAGGVTIFLSGWAQYFWIAVIIGCGLLVIATGLATYMFRRC